MGILEQGRDRQLGWTKTVLLHKSSQASEGRSDRLMLITSAQGNQPQLDLPMAKS